MDNFLIAFTDYDDYLSSLKTLETFRLKQYYLARKDYIGSNSPKYNEISDILTKKIESSYNNEFFADIESLEAIFNERLKLSENNISQYPLEQLVALYNLSDFGRFVLTLTLLTAIDVDYKTIIKLLQSKIEFDNPTVEFCAKVYFLSKDVLECNNEIYKKAMKEIKALENIFPSLKDEHSQFSSPLIPDSRLISMLCNDNFSYPQYIENFSCKTQLEPLLFRDEQLSTLTNIVDSNHNIKAIIVGEKGSGKKHLIKHFCKYISSDAIFADFNYFTKYDHNEIINNMESVALISIREGLINNAPIVIYGLDSYDEDIIKAFFSYIIYLTQNKNNNCKIFVLTEKEDLIKADENWFSLTLNDLNEEQRNIIWDLYKSNVVFAPNVSLSATANTFILTAGQIKSAISMAKLLSSGQPAVTKECLYKCCYSQTDHSLSKKAKRVKIGFGWEDLKLPPKDKDTLRDICNRIKNKHIVLNQWGFSKLLPYGGGISAVFAGPPGTGKTMAAQVIAGELGMELYQIDLSQIVDKYIGETEKNIRIIFEEAGKSNSILFFDEADSLFAKRIQNSGGNNGSNDRFANIESSLLLQCVEAYNGISILATNHYDSIDPAFIRRFKYLINFRLPTPEIRLELWKSMFPSKAPLSAEVDLKFYADKFELSGAYIKNIALYAAFLAAEERSEISDIHILKGLSKEMLKEGLKLEQSKLDNLFYLFKDL